MKIAMERNNGSPDEKCGEQDQKRPRYAGIRGARESVRGLCIAFLQQHETEMEQLMKGMDILDRYLFDGKEDLEYNLWSDIDNMLTGAWENYKSNARTTKTEVGAATETVIILYPGENQFSPEGQPAAAFERMDNTVRDSVALVGDCAGRIADDMKLLRNNMRCAVRISRPNHHPASQFVLRRTVKEELTRHKGRFNNLLEDAEIERW